MANAVATPTRGVTFHHDTAVNPVSANERLSLLRTQLLFFDEEVKARCSQMQMTLQTQKELFHHACANLLSRQPKALKEMPMSEYFQMYGPDGQLLVVSDPPATVTRASTRTGSSVPAPAQLPSTRKRGRALAPGSDKVALFDGASVVPAAPVSRSSRASSRVASARSSVLQEGIKLGDNCSDDAVESGLATSRALQTPLHTAKLGIAATTVAQTPFTVVRQPRPHEKMLSFNGSPLGLETSAPSASVGANGGAQLNLPLHNGTALLLDKHADLQALNKKLSKKDKVKLQQQLVELKEMMEALAKTIA